MESSLGVNQPRSGSEARGGLLEAHILDSAVQSHVDPGAAKGRQGEPGAAKGGPSTTETEPRGDTGAACINW